MGAMDTMMSGGAPGFTFEKVGAAVSGVVVEVDERQDHVFGEPNKLKWWNRDPGPATGNPADRPVMIPIFTIQTDIRDSEEDDGLRSVWARGNCFSAIKAAIRGAFPGGKKVSDDDVIGGTLKVQFHAVGEPPKKGLQPPKLFRAKFERRAVIDTPANGEHNELNPPPADW